MKTLFVVCAALLLVTGCSFDDPAKPALAPAAVEDSGEDDEAPDTDVPPEEPPDGGDIPWANWGPTISAATQRLTFDAMKFGNGVTELYPLPSPFRTGTSWVALGAMVPEHDDDASIQLRLDNVANPGKVSVRTRYGNGISKWMATAGNLQAGGLVKTKVQSMTVRDDDARVMTFEIPRGHVGVAFANLTTYYSGGDDDFTADFGCVVSGRQVFFAGRGAHGNRDAHAVGTCVIFYWPKGAPVRAAIRRATVRNNQTVRLNAPLNGAPYFFAMSSLLTDAPSSGSTSDRDRSIMDALLRIAPQRPRNLHGLSNDPDSPSMTVDDIKRAIAAIKEAWRIWQEIKSLFGDPHDDDAALAVVARDGTGVTWRAFDGNKRSAFTVVLAQIETR